MQIIPLLGIYSNMSTLMLTLIIAFIIVMIAIGSLAIGWLIRGKSTIRPGACGRDPTKKQETDCGPESNSNCHLCKKPEEKNK